MGNGAQMMMMHGEAAADDEWEDGGGGGCCCFGSCWGRQQRHLNRGDHSYLLSENQQRQGEAQSWVVKQLNTLKEVSEVVAGPRWKTLLRKIGAYFNNYKNNKRRNDFRYNSHDYALNFDDDDGNLALGFSSRFAPPVRP